MNWSKWNWGLLRHPPRKRIRPILQLLEPTRSLKCVEMCWLLADKHYNTTTTGELTGRMSRSRRLLTEQSWL